MESILGFLIIALIVYLLVKKSKPKGITSKRKLQLHLVELKNITKNIQNLYTGQIVSISVDDYEKDKESYSLITYPDCMNIGYLRSTDEVYGQEYSYAVLKDIFKDKITACIICGNVYLSRIKISTSCTINNGEVLEITKNNNEYKLMRDSKIIGSIIDDRINDTLLKNIAYISYDNGCALAVIYK